MGYHERLSALDASFLGIEDGNCHMHVGGVMLFETGPLRTPEGGVDIDRLRSFVGSRLHTVPRFRQRLAYIPYAEVPVWVDDERFRLAYHIRHTALPKPGDERALKRLVGRIMSQPLDRKRPLWEMWVVEGLEGDRFALINKTHHCMIDGISGADIMTVLMTPFPDSRPSRNEPWNPRPAPTRTELIVDQVVRRAQQPFEALQALIDTVRRPDERIDQITNAAAGIVEVLSPAFNPVSETPLNVPIGPHRRFDWTTMQVADLKAVKNVLGGTLNDVVLATVAGALRHFYMQRKLTPDDLSIRSLVPVSIRQADEHGQLGNRVTQMVAPLPVHVADPRERLELVTDAMAGLKESRQALGGEVLTAISEWTVPNLLVQATRLTARGRPYNLIVTNIPGPQIPLYMNGAVMQTTFPVVPLFENMALVVGLFSYNGGLFWGFNADWELVPDLHDFVLAIDSAFVELQEAAAHGAKRRTRPSHASRRRRSTRPAAAS